MTAVWKSNAGYLLAVPDRCGLGTEISNIHKSWYRESVMAYCGKRRRVVASCFLTLLWIANSICLAANTGPLTPDMLAIQGRWIRSDAPYVIELAHAPNGLLQGKYYNPKPIHVQKTEVAEKDGVLYVMVLLQDVNYRGSFYLLSYNRAHDALSGTYFHAASRQRFEVVFVRKALP